MDQVQGEKGQSIKGERDQVHKGKVPGIRGTGTGPGTKGKGTRYKGKGTRYEKEGIINQV